MRNRLCIIVDRIEGAEFTGLESLDRLYFTNRQANLAVLAMSHKTREMDPAWVGESGILGILEKNRRDLLAVSDGRPEELEAGFEGTKHGLVSGLKLLISLCDGHGAV